MHVRRLELLTNFGKIRNVHLVLFALAVGNLGSLKEPRRVESVFKGQFQSPLFLPTDPMHKLKIDFEKSYLLDTTKVNT